MERRRERERGTLKWLRLTSRGLAWRNLSAPISRRRCFHPEEEPWHGGVRADCFGRGHTTAAPLLGQALHLALPCLKLPRYKQLLRHGVTFTLAQTACEQDCSPGERTRDCIFPHHHCNPRLPALIQLSALVRFNIDVDIDRVTTRERLMMRTGHSAHLNLCFFSYCLEQGSSTLVLEDAGCAWFHYYSALN
ncbi:hypothetical protein AAFF_G00288830 [Aldrovandia affinis]|uniref:Uncharacterized protein n=1 Tax=Aldrovandia affinis TaxID=143900 RepID=A0AAD7SQX1_9TELE|nr:hypothetical protein AAFF_G00288830 [Aldrovandia affinis]